MNKMYVVYLAVCGIMASCSVSNNYSPAHKYPQQQLQQDYTILKHILQKKHPGLYWYTSKDSMDIYFDMYYRAIKDSMTETQFCWQVLAPLTDKIHCGHTSVGSSKAYSKWNKGKRAPSFPLFFKVWNDTMAVTASLNRKDSVFKRGTLVTAINGVSNLRLINKMFQYLPEDGYADNVNYIRLSSNFPYYHRSIFGLNKTYKVSYIDSTGNAAEAEVPLFIPIRDSSKKTEKEKPARVKKPKEPKEKRRLRYRSMTIDSSGKFATLTLNTFSKGRLRTFFSQSFSELKHKNIQHLILDIRNNGGGKVAVSTLLTRYISRKPFKVADSVYAVAPGVGSFAKYIRGGWFNNVEMFFISRKRKDGLYHLGLLERKTYQPKKVNHYNGNVYVIISGPTFSASSLFCNAVKGQEGILLVGEETGGGWHGNNGIMIPDIKLPNTKVTVRLPLYRVVQYNHVPKNGSGVMPDVYVGTNYKALIEGVDFKMKVVTEMILAR